MEFKEDETLPVYSKNCETGEFESYLSVLDAAEATGLTRDDIVNAIMQGHDIDGLLFDYAL